MGMGSDILVIKTKTLFKEGYFEGFLPLSKKDYLSAILSASEYRKRTPELEEDKEWQQPIPYVWIINSKENKVFLYKRSITGNEGRLHSKYSGGVGGHIDKDTEENSENPILGAMMRELEEEVRMDAYPKPKIIGFINLSGGVEEVHFGIVAIAETDKDVFPMEDMDSGKFYSLEEADILFSQELADVERWTILSWPFIKKYILSGKIN